MKCELCHVQLPPDTELNTILLLDGGVFWVCSACCNPIDHDFVSRVLCSPRDRDVVVFAFDKGIYALAYITIQLWKSLPPPTSLEDLAAIVVETSGAYIKERRHIHMVVVDRVKDICMDKNVMSIIPKIPCPPARTVD